VEDLAHFRLGVTIVQLRDKTSETRDLIAISRALKKICSKHNVPFLVNDRVDVALAADADGVHIGQDDMSKFASKRSFDD